MKLSDALVGYWLEKRLSMSETTIPGYERTFARLVLFLGDVEAALKRKHNGRLLCPICNGADPAQPGLFDDLTFHLADVAEMEF